MYKRHGVYHVFQDKLGGLLENRDKNLRIPQDTSTNKFCDAVIGCLPDPLITGAGVTGNISDGFVLPDNTDTNTYVEFGAPDSSSGTVTTVQADGNAGPTLCTFCSTQTQTETEGGTFEEDVELPDGSVLAAGDPVPADTVCLLYTSPSPRDRG